MKTNPIKDYALATIEKAQELTKRAEEARLHLSIEVNICQENGHIAIYELEDDGKNKNSSIYFKHFSFLNKISEAKRFARCLDEVESFVAGYKRKDQERLEQQQAELRKALAAVNKDLRKVRNSVKREASNA